MTGALLPTAAKALLPTKWPTTATSTELKSSCNKTAGCQRKGKQQNFLEQRPVQHIDLITLGTFFSHTVIHLFTFFKMRGKVTVKLDKMDY